MNIERLERLKTVLRRVAEMELDFDLTKWGAITINGGEDIDDVFDMPMDTRLQNSIPAKLGVLDNLSVLQMLEEFASIANHEIEGFPKDPPKCGFSACALGWAALDPELRKQGLEASFSLAGGMEVFFEGELGIYAAAGFFEIERGEAEWLFMPAAYGEPDDYGSGATPEDVIDHIDKLINRTADL